MLCPSTPPAFWVLRLELGRPLGHFMLSFVTWIVFSNGLNRVSLVLHFNLIGRRYIPAKPPWIIGEAIRDGGRPTGRALRDHREDAVFWFFFGCGFRVPWDFGGTVQLPLAIVQRCTSQEARVRSVSGRR